MEMCGEWDGVGLEISVWRMISRKKEKSDYPVHLNRISNTGATNKTTRKE